jgi:hypothetical protein
LANVLVVVAVKLAITLKNVLESIVTDSLVFLREEIFQLMVADVIAMTIAVVEALYPIESVIQRGFVYGRKTGSRGTVVHQMPTVLVRHAFEKPVCVAVLEGGLVVIAIKTVLPRQLKVAQKVLA